VVLLPAGTVVAGGDEVGDVEMAADDGVGAVVVTAGVVVEAFPAQLTYQIAQMPTPVTARTATTASTAWTSSRRSRGGL
jgi:hypothetical protein